MSPILLLVSVGLAAPASKPAPQPPSQPALPEVTVKWARDVARVSLTPSPGPHIEPDAPVSGWRWTLVWAAGAAVLVGVAVTRLPPALAWAQLAWPQPSRPSWQPRCP